MDDKLIFINGIFLGILLSTVIISAIYIKCGTRKSAKESPKKPAIIQKCEYDEKGNEIYREYSDGTWEKRKYDANSNNTYYENSNSYWVKSEYDSNGNLIHLKDSKGLKVDKQEQTQTKPDPDYYEQQEFKRI